MTSMRDLIIGGQRVLDGQKVWPHDRTAYLNASEASQCIRQLWYAKHTPELAEEQDWGFAWRGHMAEEYIMRCLHARNDTQLRYEGPFQISVQDDKRRISATPDGVMRIEDGEWQGLEIKSIDPRTNRKNLPREKDVIQFRLAMALLNQRDPDPIDPTPPLTRGRLIYIDASNYNDIVEFSVEPADEPMLARYAKKAAKVFRTKNVDGLDREGKRNDGCKYCPFTATCGVTKADAVTGRKRTRRGSNLDTAAQRYIAIADQTALLKAEQDDLKESIKAALKGKAQHIVGDIEVTLSSIAGRESLDKKAVAAAGIDLAPFTKVGAPSERLTVKRVD